MVCNLSYIRQEELQDIWGQGFVKINQISHVDNLGAYLVKYMSKNCDERLNGRKYYFRTCNLDKPKEIIDKQKVDKLLNQLPANKRVYKNKYHNEYTGNLTYEQYNLER